MIIWGSRGLTSTIDSRQFHCPQCGTGRSSSLKQVRNFFTLYFIPVIPLNVAGRYVECGSCGGTFAEEALDYDPEKAREETNMQMLRVMILAALADGSVDEDECDEIRKQYMEIAGLPVSGEVLEQEIRLATEAKADLNSFVSRFVDELTPHGKALVVKLAFHTMTASSELQSGHHAALTKLASTLQIPEDQYRALIEHLNEATEEV